MTSKTPKFPVTSHVESVQPGGVFVAIPSIEKTTFSLVQNAIERGAKTVVVEKNDVASDHNVRTNHIADGVRYVLVPCARRALARYAAQAAGNPAEKLTIIGVTGSRGKAITASLITHLLRDAGHAVALLGADENEALCRDAYAIGVPGSDYLHPFFAQCVERGVTHIVMPVSAHALSLYRVHEVPFSHVVLTNFSPEHSDLFGSVPRYLNIKKRLFKQCLPDGRAHLLAGKVCDELYEVLPAQRSLITMQFDRATDSDQVVYDVVDDTLEHLELVLHEGNQDISVVLGPVGGFNASNIALAASVARACGAQWDELVPSLAQWRGVPGHVERTIIDRNVTVVSDVIADSHGIDTLLAWLGQQTDHLITVLDCSSIYSPRDGFAVGIAAARQSDVIVLIAQPEQGRDIVSIANQIRLGAEQQSSGNVVVHIEIDRAAAQKKACYKLAHSGGVVALLAQPLAHDASSHVSEQVLSS